MSTDRLHEAAELADWARQHTEVQMGILSVTRSRGCTSLGQLAIEHPDAFDELHDAMKTMLEELPWT